MGGVLIFADDNIFSNGTSEYELYNLLRSEHPVVPFDNIDHAERAIKSINNFTALILDWNFKRKMEGAPSGVKLEDDTPLQLLRDYDIYSHIYVYSTENIDSAIQEELTSKFGNRIKFRMKEFSDIDKEKSAILDEITEWKEETKDLFIPRQWSNSVNQGLQKIFFDLSNADSKWIKHLYETSEKDGMDPASSVITIFQTLLTEQLIKDPTLKETITTFNVTGTLEGDEAKSFEKLFQRLYYSNSDTAHLSTGDIFQLTTGTNPGDGQFGIVMTPECDLKGAKTIEVLTFRKNSFTKKYKLLIPKDLQDRAVENLDIVKSFFNQSDPNNHILPSFNFGESTLPIIINFRENREFWKKPDLIQKNKIGKLNAPYIQQLRQRFLSYQGRIGVPAIPDALKQLNIDSSGIFS